MGRVWSLDLGEECQTFPGYGWEYWSRICKVEGRGRLRRGEVMANQKARRPQWDSAAGNLFDTKFSLMALFEVQTSSHCSPLRMKLLSYD